MDYIVYIMGALITVLVVFVIVSNYMDVVSENIKVEIKTLEYLEQLDPSIWPSEEEGRLFSCDLCRYGTANHVNIGNITCPDYPLRACGCDISIKLKFQSIIETGVEDGVTCTVKVNGNIASMIEEVTKGEMEHNILLGLSAGGQIDRDNRVEVCCNSICESKILPKICD